MPSQSWRGHLVALLDEALRGIGPGDARKCVADVRRELVKDRVLELMDSGMSTAARVEADVRIAGRRQDFDLPVWRDNSGDLRIGLPKIDPEHSGDMDQIVLDVGDLLSTIGKALVAR